MTARPRPRPATRPHPTPRPGAGLHPATTAAALVTLALLASPGCAPHAARPPVFAGFTDARYQEHDRLIERLVAEFNADKAAAIGADADQAHDIPNLWPTLVKAWLIQETGGNDPRSRAAWAVDPAQVNHPGDWSPEKASLGLHKPAATNTGSLDQNLRAAIAWLARKGFSTSGRPPAELPRTRFDGWRVALERYNGRTAVTANNRPYRVNYADAVFARAANPHERVPIALPRPR